MAADREQLERAIGAQESLRGTVPDDVIDIAVHALRRQLSELDAATSRRRQVTVLFADVSGFTSMSDRMDAELVAGIMNDLWARLDLVVAEHGGSVDKHIGDAVMAVWGAVDTREDDPERAVRAALAMHHEMAAFRAQSEAPGDRDDQAHATNLSMRIGISTGPVHLGAVGAANESTVMGDTVNLASRLEHLAPVGGVLISHDTYRNVRGVFDVQPLGEVEVRGKRDPVRLYVVERAKPRAFRQATRGVEGVETRTIGRDAELHVLQTTFRRMVDGGGAALVMVVADAGTGKSRLLYEFLNWLELTPTEAYLFTGRALANRQTAALGLLRDVIATRFDIHDSDPSPSVTVKLHRGFAGHLSAEEAEIVGHWLGFELSSRAAVQRLLGPQFSTTARAHLLEFFRSVCSADPLVVAVEDLHWADDESLDILGELVAHLRTDRVLVLGLARPTLFERRPDLPRDDVPLVRVELRPLSDADSRALVREVLQHVAEVPDELIDLVVGRAEGNAFYVEELIKMLADDGVIDTSDEDAWGVDVTRLEHSSVPSTLTGVLQARLDTLAAHERRALQCASIVGRVFWDAAVNALTGEPAATDSALDVAERRELVFRRSDTSFVGVEEYLFKHALLCDVAYETVLLRERPALHRSVAAWLETAAGERIAEYREMIAAHLAAAGEADRAAEHLWHAGQTLLATGTPAAAARSLSRAVELWDTGRAEPPPAALLLLTEALLRVDDFISGREVLERARASVRTASERLDVLYLSSWVAMFEEQTELERSLLEDALPLAEEVGGQGRARVLVGLAWSYGQAGDLEGAERHARRAVALCEELGDTTGTCRALGVLGVMVGELGRLSASQECVERELALAEATGNLDEQARAHSNLGVVLHLRGDAEGDARHYEVAVTHYRLALDLFERLGEPHNAVRMRLNTAQACVRLGRDADARAAIRPALAAAVQLRAERLQHMGLIMEADRRLAIGDTAAGLAYVGLYLRDAPAGEVDRHEAERVLDRVRGTLAPDVIQAGLVAGAELDLRRVIDDLLAPADVDTPKDPGRR